MATRDYPVIGSQEELEKLLQNQAALSRPKKTTTTTASQKKATNGIYPVKTAGNLPAPGSKIRELDEWQRLGGNVPASVMGKAAAQSDALNGKASLAQTAADMTGGGLGYGSPAGSGDRYNSDLARLYDQAMKSNYSSPYDGKAEELYAQIMGRQPYQSEYGGQIAELYGQLNNRGAYQSQYGDKIADLYGQLNNRGAYQSQYGDQIADLYGQLNNRGAYQSQYGDQIADLYGQLSGRGPYQSPYETQIKNLYDTIINRPKFSYDANKDPLYQQYREQYARGGQQAMRDTMGASAALTGGYGNSWGNTAGYQAYQNYMAALNDKIPELSQQAFDRYQQEGSDLQNQMALAQAMDNAGYSRWQDEGDALRQQLALAQAMDEAGYGRWKDEGDALRQQLALAQAMDEAGYGRWQDEGDALRQQLATAQAMDEAGYGRWQDEGDALRQRLSTALALDEDAYNRYQQAGDELRQNFNAANNLRDSDWQRYLQQQGLLQDQIALAQQMRDNELQYQAASGALMAPYMEQIQQMIAEGMQPIQDLQLAAGLPVGAAAQTPASSNFNAREYAASLAGVKAGQLKKDQSPITTLGGVKNSNNWYDQVYQAMDEAAQNKSTGSGKSGTGGTKAAGSGTGSTGAPQKKNWDDTPLSTPLSPSVKKFQQIYDEYNKKQ